MSKHAHVNAAYVSDSGKRASGIDDSQLEIGKKFQNADDSYDPYEHRQVAHPLSNTESIIHLLKCSLGTGILAMPQAIYHAGYVLGAIGTAAIGILCLYCIQLLLESHYELCKRKKVPSMEYPTIAKYAFLEGPEWLHKFAPFIEHLTIGLLFVYQIGSCCIYVVFIADNIKSIVDEVTGSDIDNRIFMCMIVLPIILINWVRNLKYLAPFSTIANIVTVISFGIIFYFIFRDPVTLVDRRLIGPPKEIPFFIGTVLFSLESIGVVMPLENEMRTPKAYKGKTGVLSRAFAMIIILYVAMGVFGYLRYGDKIDSTITKNLDLDGPVDIGLARAVKGMLAFGIFITHGVACFVAFDLSWTEYIVHRITNESHKIYWEYLLRTLLATLTFLLAVAIPTLDLFISLIGALCLSLLGLGLPSLIEYLVFAKTMSGFPKTVLIIKCTFVVVCAILAMIVGTFTSLQAIFEHSGKKA